MTRLLVSTLRRGWPLVPFMAVVVAVIWLGTSMMPPARVATCQSEHARMVVRTYLEEKHTSDAPVPLANIVELDTQAQGDRVTQRRCRVNVALRDRQVPITYTISMGEPGASAVHVKDPSMVEPE